MNPRELVGWTSSRYVYHICDEEGATTKETINNDNEWVTNL